jgi:hypothetical protein
MEIQIISKREIYVYFNYLFGFSFSNMTGLISRSKKRTLNAMRSNRFRDFTVVKSNDATFTSSSIVEEVSTAPEDDTTDAKVKFTVVLPPKKSSPSKDDGDDDDEGSHRSKRQRRRSWDDDKEDDRRRKEKTHFTVTLDPVSKHRKDLRNKLDEAPKFNKE